MNTKFELEKLLHSAADQFGSQLETLSFTRQTNEKEVRAIVKATTLNLLYMRNCETSARAEKLSLTLTYPEIYGPDSHHFETFEIVKHSEDAYNPRYQTTCRRLLVQTAQPLFDQSPNSDFFAELLKAAKHYRQFDANRLLHPGVFAISPPRPPPTHEIGGTFAYFLERFYATPPTLTTW